MKPRRNWSTSLIAVVLTVVGFVGGALGAAWYKRDQRAEPWREMRVVHQGVSGATTRTRVIFDNPKLPLQGVEVIRNPEGMPELAHVEVRGAGELTVRYERGRKPSSLHSADGTHAVFTYKGGKARVMFLAADGTELGNEVVQVPGALRRSLRLSHRDRGARGAAGTLAAWAEALSPIGRAHAQPAKKAAGDKKPAEDEQISVTREVQVMLDVTLPGKDDPGEARIEASCAPFTCLPHTSKVPVPGSTRARIAVTSSIARSKLTTAPTPEALGPFRELAGKERQTAAKVLSDVEGVVAIVGVTAAACRALNKPLPVCVSRLRRTATVSAALHSIDGHAIPNSSVALGERASELFYEEQARAQLDREAVVEVCLNRKGYGTSCTKLKGRPLGAEPMPYVRRGMPLRRGIAGSLNGQFTLTQADGPDCKFSPSPSTEGPLRLDFNNKTGLVTAKLSADARGTRAGLRCSLGSGDMRWTQRYTATLTQTFKPEELQSGGSLALRLRGTMSGSGSASQSNCRTPSGQSASCPGGRSNTYAYPMELLGNLDLGTKVGSGQLVVSKAPLRTRGSWRTPAEGAKP